MQSEERKTKKKLDLINVFFLKKRKEKKKTLIIRNREQSTNFTDSPKKKASIDLKR